MSASSWDLKFLRLAAHIGEWSKDRSRKVGAVIVGPDNNVVATGYNGFPRGVDDSREERHQRPAKYLWTEHAERNAIFNAALNGMSTKGCTVYLPWHPCADCARAIINSGITTLVMIETDLNALPEQWKNSMTTAAEMFNELQNQGRFLVIRVKAEDLDPPTADKQIGGQ